MVSPVRHRCPHPRWCSHPASLDHRGVGDVSMGGQAPPVCTAPHTRPAPGSPRGIHARGACRHCTHSCRCVTDGVCPMPSVILCLVSDARGCYGHRFSWGDPGPVALFFLVFRTWPRDLSCLCGTIYPCLMTLSGDLAVCWRCCPYEDL